MSENLDRLTYRNSPSSMAFAVKTILLSVFFGSCFFIIIPLTAKMDTLDEKKLTQRSVPERIFLNKERVEKVELANKKKRKVKKELVKIEPQVDIPQVPVIAAVPVKIKLAALESPVSLTLNTNFKTNMNFAVEKVKAIAHPQEKPSTGNIKPDKKVDVIDYNRVFSLGELDQKAVRIKGIKPNYPHLARRRGISGKVVISCIINDKGYVVSPQIITSTPKGYFEEACLNSLKTLVYKPATKDGKNVSVRLLINFPFGFTK